jgi:hypothetical protein
MGPQDASDCIWLKQSVQFSVAGQVRTLEITLPVRPGTSAEEIERLLRQADAGLDQMTQHLNGKVNDLLAQAKTQPAAAAAGSSRHSPPVPGTQEPAAPGEQGRPGSSSVSAGAQSGMAVVAAEGAEWSFAHSAAAVSASAGPPLDRKQFIAEIAVLGFNPNTAMKRLGLRTLDGVNLRQALEQLRLQLLHERPASAGEPARQADDSGLSASGGPRSQGAAPLQSGAPPRRPSPELQHPSLLSQPAPVEGRVLRPLLEGDLLPDEEDQRVTDVVTSERHEHLRVRERVVMPIPIRGERTPRSLQEQVQAQSLLERLRHIRGRLNPPSSDNLKAFRHVVEEQIGVEKTTALLQAVWNVPQPEQLSPDQVAECIRWGKDDHFEDEVDMLLKLTAAEES